MFRSITWKIALPAFVVGAIMAFSLPESGQIQTWLIFNTLILLFLFILNYFDFDQKWLIKMAWAVAFLAIGLQWSLWRTNLLLKNQWVASDNPQSVVLNVEVIGLPERDATKRVRFIGKAQTEDGRSYRILFQDYNGLVWQVGERWQVKARVRATIGTRNPVGFDREAWALANHIDGVASVAKERSRLPESGFFQKKYLNFNLLRAKISESWNGFATDYPNGSGLMKALAMGDRSGLSYEMQSTFRPLGINHLISISGLHISMVGVLVMWLTKRILRMIPKTPKRPRLWVLAAGASSALIYTGLAGFEIPALRSLLMLLLFSWAWLWRSAWGVWRVWWTALALILLYQPTAALSVGFWLSFGLVGTLLWALVGRLPEKKWIQIVQAQWAATLIGGLATIAFFGVLPIFSPVVNAVAIPFFSWILVPVALLASFIPLDFLKWIASALGEYTATALLFLGERLPETAFAHSPMFLIWIAIFSGLLFLLPNGLRIKPLALCGVLAMLLYRPPFLDSDSKSKQVKVTVWDVGQGLSILIQTPKKNILFDTGTPAAEMSLLPNLRALGVKQIDTLILSHHDDDHDGGFEHLKKSFPIKKLWAGQPEFYSQAEYCQKGIHWQEDNGVFFEFLTPNLPNNQKDNDKSCVLRMIVGEQAMLITGDIGFKGEKILIDEFGDNLFSQLLILGHHGSKSSSSSAFINRVAPEMAVASSGFANAFKHPHPDVQTILQAHGVKLWRTDRQGALKFIFTEKEIRTELAVSQKKWWQRKPFLE